jgi:hypothetical protein
VGRGAQLEALQQVAKLGICFSAGEADGVKHLLLDVAPVCVLVGWWCGWLVVRWLVVGRSSQPSEA